MANELKHGSVGTELTQAEWEGVGAHVFNSQATGDIVYASSSSQLSRLAKGTDTHVLILSSGIPAWSTSTGITALGTIATGVWQGTDVGVAYGGTGVSTLTDGGILLGSGASAITAMAVLTDGQMIVGDGTTDPVAESGATLRTSIGVGAGDSPTFAGLTLDLTQDYTFLTRGDTLAVQSQTDDTQSAIELYSKKGDGGDDVLVQFYGVGTPASFTNREALKIGYDGGDTTFIMNVYEVGSATVRNFELQESGSAWLSKAAAGNVTISAPTGADVLIGDNATLLTVDGGAPGVKIGTGALTANTHFDIDPATFTATAGSSARVIRVVGTITEAGSGTHASIGGMEINPPTITGGSAAVTDTFTVKIVNAPTATVTGTNYALWVDGGVSRFDGYAGFGTTTTALSAFVEAIDINQLSIMSWDGSNVESKIGFFHTDDAPGGAYLLHNATYNGTAWSCFDTGEGSHQINFAQSGAMYFGAMVSGNGEPTIRMGIDTSGNLDLMGNSSWGLVNVGASGNDWTQNALSLAGGSAAQVMTMETTGTGVDNNFYIKLPASSTGQALIQFVQGSGNGDANNMGHLLGYYANGPYFYLRSADIDGSSTAGDIFQIADGTDDVYFLGGIGVGVAAPTSGMAVAGDVVISGTTPTLTIGDAGTEDAKIIFDGNEADYHIGLEDANNNFVIGIDSTLGTKQVITINDDGHISFGGPDPSAVVLALFNADARSVPAGYSEVGLMAIAGSNTLTLATGATGLVSSLILYPANIVEAGGDGVTNTATLYVGAAATEGSAGNYSFWVDAGSVRLDSSLWVEGTPTEGSAGEQLTSGGADTVMSWAAASSLGQFKDTIDVLSPEDALDKIVSWIPKSFRYKADAEMSTHDYDTTYVGVYGEDAPEVMHHEGRIFSPVSAFGYTVGAIQELHNKIQKLEAQLAAS